VGKSELVLSSVASLRLRGVPTLPDTDRGGLLAYRRPEWASLRAACTVAHVVLEKLCLCKAQKPGLCFQSAGRYELGVFEVTPGKRYRPRWASATSVSGVYRGSCSSDVISTIPTRLRRSLLDAPYDVAEIVVGFFVVTRSVGQTADKEAGGATQSATHQVR
jgi:hypothetical protein